MPEALPPLPVTFPDNKQITTNIFMNKIIINAMLIEEV
jgi:hypothetical protein